jgi:hypothetical protein
MSIGRNVAAANRDEAATTIARTKERILAEIRKAGHDSPLSNHDLYARINDGLDRKLDRLRIVPVADISSATGALKADGVLAEVGVGKNEKGNKVTLMTLGEWAPVPPKVDELREAKKLRAKITRELVKLDPARRAGCGGGAVMRYLECMIAWTPAEPPLARGKTTAGQVRVGPWPDPHPRWSDDYVYTIGACFTDSHAMNAEQLKVRMLGDFVAVVMDVDPRKAYREFLKIDEFRAIFEP